MHKTRNYIPYDQGNTSQSSFRPCSFEAKWEMSCSDVLLPRWARWQTQMAGSQPSLLSREKETPHADEETFDWANENNILKAHHWSQRARARPSKACRSRRQSSRCWAVRLLGLREKVSRDKRANEWDESRCQYGSHEREGCVIPGVLAPLT